MKTRRFRWFLAVVVALTLVLSFVSAPAALANNGDEYVEVHLYSPLSDVCIDGAGTKAELSLPENGGFYEWSEGDQMYWPSRGTSPGLCPDDPPPPVDTDGDGIPDDQDTYPYDRDNDGVNDDVDNCPDEAGDAAYNGCQPPPPPVDTDGDGIPDDQDTYPYDRDNDGVNDDVDNCPDEAGDAAYNGCQPPPPPVDTDGDGIPDDQDTYPYDRDNDGVNDDVDNCPDEAGPDWNDGCEVPGYPGDIITTASHEGASNCHLGTVEVITIITTTPQYMDVDKWRPVPSDSGLITTDREVGSRMMTEAELAACEHDTDPGEGHEEPKPTTPPVPPAGGTDGGTDTGETDGVTGRTDVAVTSDMPAQSTGAVSAPATPSSVTELPVAGSGPSVPVSPLMPAVMAALVLLVLALKARPRHA